MSHIYASDDFSGLNSRDKPLWHDLQVRKVGLENIARKCDPSIIPTIDDRPNCLKTFWREHVDIVVRTTSLRKNISQVRYGSTSGCS